MTTTARIESFEVMADASGAPAVISVGFERWAFDMCGVERCSGLRVRGMGRRSVKIARAAYRKLLTTTVSAEWLAANRAMYPEAE